MLFSVLPPLDLNQRLPVITQLSSLRSVSCTSLHSPQAPRGKHCGQPPLRDCFLLSIGSLCVMTNKKSQRKRACFACPFPLSLPNNFEPLFFLISFMPLPRNIGIQKIFSRCCWRIKLRYIQIFRRSKFAALGGYAPPSCLLKNDACHFITP